MHNHGSRVAGVGTRGDVIRFKHGSQQPRKADLQRTHRSDQSDRKTPGRDEAWDVF